MSGGLIANQISRLTSETVQELSWSPPRDRLRGRERDLKRYSLEDCAEVLLLDEVIGFCFNLLKLRAKEAFGVYSHPQEKITDWMRGVLADMDDSLEKIVGQMVAIAFFFGPGTAEIGWKYDTPGYWGQQRLKCIHVLNPLKTRFKGNKYGLLYVVDKSGEKDKDIPYLKCLHVSNDLYEDDPYGYGAGMRTIGLFKAKRTLLSEWVVSGKNQATGLWTVQADSNDTVVIYGADGKPLQENGEDKKVSAIANAYQQLEEFDKHNFLVMDKRYTINWQQMPVDSGFFSTVLDNIDRRLFMTMNVPYLIANEGSGGFGYTGVAAMQATTLDAQISSLVKQVRDQIIEKIIRPMLIRNFGLKPKDGWGKFDVDKSSDPAQSGAKVMNILSAIGAGVLPTSDPNVVNEIRRLLDLPHQSEEEQLAAVMKAVQIQQMQQQAAGQAAPEEAAPPPTGDEAAKQKYP